MMKKNKKKRKRRSIFVFLLLLLVQTSISCFPFLLFPIFLILLLLPASTTKPHLTVNTTTMNKQLSSAYTSRRIRTDLRRCGAVTSRVARPNGNTTLQIVTVRVGTQIQYHCEFHHPLWYIMHSYDHQIFIFSVLTCSMRCFKRSNSSRCFSLFIKS